MSTHTLAHFMSFKGQNIEIAIQTIIFSDNIVFIIEWNEASEKALLDKLEIQKHCSNHQITNCLQQIE